ncbi:formylmethanofuran dehydrogenase subunit A [Beggiatoa leptomitoformis]|uniref:Formylmethanofuran dehydrogenase subunit A n=1 Tax=Beggiatoa leptomitoformis TaxID=288004 RepID=A0A2N9YED5_9GAMM|nr:formylmethanofuran dehydrogenase subunit A [Beggiatoa leptomitoformis]ALG68813.1 formylmethanofuran dehydrogenase subunit A [Beggiatoa leptomitoformis]AUI68824.1 formylmethanofuran dehydrogenase subunit A [Beggiatoa leptomitoformis]
MLTKLSNCKIYDPTQQKNGVVEDIYIQDGRIVAKPLADTRIDQHYDMQHKVVMAGAIDIHSHIGGGKVNIARQLLPESRDYLRESFQLEGEWHQMLAPTTRETGIRYAEMGYTAVFEPALLPVNARQAHLEMLDTPMIDKGGYAMLGNDDYFLRLLSSGADQRKINDYVAWILEASQCIGIKVVNAGGISAFKFNQRRLELDEQNCHYPITPRQVLHSLATAVQQLGVPHPLHVHGSNLGVPGNIDTTIDTIQGMEGLPVHLTHIQFHSYGTEGDHRFSSGAARIAEAINQHHNISVDVGQIMFGQTVTASGDTMMQYHNHRHANPKKWVVMDIECDAGCGVVPFRYRDKNFVNALQWAIGLETFLLVDDPWRIFLTTDHPNGAPFTSYPHLVKLLMDKSFRNDMLATINPTAAAMSTLGSITREYSLYEIAIMTRAGAAKVLGLHDRGHLGVGAMADITVYTEHSDKEKMFAQPDFVFKNGELIVKQGKVIKFVQGGTHVVRPEYDRSIETELKDYFSRYHTIAMEHFKVADEEIVANGRGGLLVHPCA